MRRTKELNKREIQAGKGLKTKLRNQKSWYRGRRSYWRDFESEDEQGSSLIKEVRGVRENQHVQIAVVRKSASVLVLKR